MAEQGPAFFSVTRSPLVISVYCRTDMLVKGLVGAFQLILPNIGPTFFFFSMKIELILGEAGEGWQYNGISGSGAWHTRLEFPLCHLLAL